jgi:hypothetical protein
LQHFRYYLRLKIRSIIFNTNQPLQHNMMKKSFTLFLLIIAAAFLAFSSQPILKANDPHLKIFENGRLSSSGWVAWAPAGLDVYKTSAQLVTFASDIDTITFSGKTNESTNFVVLLNGKDSAFTQIKWVSPNPLEDVPQEITKVAPSGKLSRAQAKFDIDALIYTISQVHPNMFSVCNQGAYLQAVSDVKASLPDSLTNVELYNRVAPLVTLIGDGHTTMNFPYDIFSDNNARSTLKRMPLILDVDSNDSTFTVTSCIDNIIPIGAKVLSVNGNSYKDIAANMMRYASGERYFFKLIRLHDINIALFQSLYKADKYNVTYEYKGQTRQTTLLPMTVAESESRMSGEKSKNSAKPYYSLRIIKGKKIAVMDFRSFSNPQKMKSFADSMFSVLKKNKINDLIIDIRHNGGGISEVGDVLFQYISPVPFQQFGSAIMRITPTTQKLLGSTRSTPNWYYQSSDNTSLIPLQSNPLRFTGKVYLLISHNTFSSAGSFSWAFKQFKMGTIIGEESGGMNVCFGDRLEYTLPVSHLTCGISYKRFWQYDADETDIHGTIPDFQVPEKDALDYAIKLIGNK